MHLFTYQSARGSTSFNRYVTLLFIFAFLFSGYVNAKDSETEELVVYKLYRDFSWVAVIKSDSVFIPIAKQPKNILGRYFDSDLSNLLAKDANCNRRAGGEVCKLNFDPLFASQDPAAQNLVVRKTAAGVVFVEFIYPPSGEKIRLIYKTHLEKRGWRITDILTRQSNRFIRQHIGFSDV